MTSMQKTIAYSAIAVGLLAIFFAFCSSIHIAYHVLTSSGLTKIINFLYFCLSLWHKMDIGDFHCHKNVNFCNNFVALTIADDLKCKIWEV